MENIHFDEVSGDASRPPDHSNHPKNNQNVRGLNPVILETVEEDVVGFQGHHSPLDLEGSGAVDVPGVISNDGPGITSRKSPMFSSSEFLPSSSNTPNNSITSVLQKRSPRLTPKSLMMPSSHNADTPITTNSSYNNKSNNIT